MYLNPILWNIYIEKILVCMALLKKYSVSLYHSTYNVLLVRTLVPSDQYVLLNELKNAEWSIMP